MPRLGIIPTLSGSAAWGCPFRFISGRSDPRSWCSVMAPEAMFSKPDFYTRRGVPHSTYMMFRGLLPLQGFMVAIVIRRSADRRHLVRRMCKVVDWPRILLGLVIFAQATISSRSDPRQALTKYWDTPIPLETPAPPSARSLRHLSSARQGVA